MIDTIKGTITYLTAAVAIVLGMMLAFIAYVQPIPEGGGRDIGILYGFLGLIVGGAVTFLFTRETATQATRAAQSSSAMGAATATTVTPAPPNPPTSGG